jgi:hypothetical protein
MMEANPRHTTELINLNLSERNTFQMNPLATPWNVTDQGASPDAGQQQPQQQPVRKPIVITAPPEMLQAHQHQETDAAGDSHMSQAAAATVKSEPNTNPAAVSPQSPPTSISASCQNNNNISSSSASQRHAGHDGGQSHQLAHGSASVDSGGAGDATANENQRYFLRSRGN